jgi:fatty acid desaturase
MDYWLMVLGMMQVYVPSIGLFFVGGVLGHGIANGLSFSLRAEWSRWMTTLYLFSLLIPLPLWVEGALFYSRIWLVYALLSLVVGIARGLAFPAREEMRRRLRQKLQRAQESIQQTIEQQHNQTKHMVCLSTPFSCRNIREGCLKEKAT